MSFLNSIFLIGLAAAAVPVIIHLLNRRRIRRVKFSSLEFLDEVNRRRMRRINLRRIIILILRTLAVLLLVMAFARPTIRNAGFLVPGKAPKNVVVCLDASYSMGVAQEQGTAFTLAQDLCKQVIDEAGKNDKIHVVVFSGRADVQFENGTRNKNLAKGAVDDAQLTAETTSIKRAVDKAYELINTSDIDGGEIYVVSDFRYTEDSTTAAATTADRPDNVRVYYLPVYDEVADNVSIDRVMVPRKLLRPGEVARVSVVVTNHSPTTPANFPLELRVDQARKAEKVVSLAPTSSATVTFPISFVDWGTYRCRVSKNRDRLAIDDNRYFQLEVSRSVPVTIIRGARSVGSGGDSQAAGYFYLEKALNPRASGEGEFTVTTIDEKDLTAAALPARGVVVWVNPRRLEQKRLTLLRRYVNRGGGLVVFLGNSERQLFDSREFREFLGLKAASERRGDVQSGYTSFQQDHPVFNIFNEDELKLLSRTRVESYVSARGVAPDSVLAYIGGGDPALWEASRGNGRILVFAAAPDLESGDIPLSPMFLPLVHTSVSYLASAGLAQRAKDNAAGDQLYFDVDQNLITSQLLIRDPEGEPLRPVVFETPQGDSRVICERPQRVGFYQLMKDTTAIAQAVVNVDARESDIATRNLPVDESAVSVVATGGDFVANLKQKREGREIFALFLFLAAAALVAESVLGRRA